MKKLLTTISFALLIVLGCEKDHIDGPGDSPFMEKLSATLPAEGGEEVLKAESFFFSIQYLASIQEEDTVKQTFPDFNAGIQMISGSWFTVETIGDGENTLPKEIKVTAQTNDTSTERQLIFRVWNGEQSNVVTITQSMD